MEGLVVVFGRVVMCMGKSKVSVGTLREQLASAYAVSRRRRDVLELFEDSTFEQTFNDIHYAPCKDAG